MWGSGDAGGQRQLEDSLAYIYVHLGIADFNTSVVYFSLLRHCKFPEMADMSTFNNLSLERHGNVFVLTMQKPPENRLNSAYCQEMIRAYRTVENILGSGSEGAVITRGNDTKFWCTVGTTDV